MIFRSCVWFSPPQPPIIMESTAIVSRSVGLMVVII